MNKYKEDDSKELSFLQHRTRIVLLFSLDSAIIKPKAVIDLKIKAAIFDMDGTLVDSLMIWDVLWSTFGEKYLNDKTFAPTKEDDKKVRTLVLSDAMELIHNNYNLGESGAELLALANSVMNDFYENRVELKSGVREFLEHCRDNGVKMCIASATAPALIDVAIKHCGIGKYFLNVFSCDVLGKGKEQPDIYLLACDFLGEKPEETWVFEDSLTAIETATKIGMPTVGIYDRFNFGQETIRKTATEYIQPDETLLKLIKQ